MKSFFELAESRKNWISQVLTPWCRVAALMDLRLAEFEWTDIAGKVDPARTLWYWAWSRFPQLVHDELAGIDETRAVCVSLKNGDCATGYPDARRSQRGELYLVALGKQGTRNSTELGPFAIDQISEVTRS